MDFKVIPTIFNTVDQELTEKPRDIAAMAQFLEWSYQLLEHPVFKKWELLEAIDPFDIHDISAEQFARFNRTAIVRTIGQARQCARAPLFENRSMALHGKGIEMNISVLNSVWYELNALVEWDVRKMSSFQVAIEFKRLKLQGELIAVIKFFLFDCNEMILLHMKHHMQLELHKISSQGEKGAYLLKAQKDILLQKDQLWVSVFAGVNEFLNIELAYFRALKEHERADPSVESIRQFLEQTSSRISSGRLLGYLLTDQTDRFCDDLTEFAMRVLSSHDVGGNDPEKVYHLFLVGIFCAFGQHFELSSNREAGLGRFDICLRPYIPGNKGLIFEVKRCASNKKEAVDAQLQNALEQVRIQQYGYAFKEGGATEFTAIAAVFFGKEIFFKYAVLPIP